MRSAGAHPRPFKEKGSLREAGRLLYLSAPYLFTASVLLSTWQYASTQINPIFFPSPAKVLSAVWRLNTEGNFFIHVEIVWEGCGPRRTRRTQSF